MDICKPIALTFGPHHAVKTKRPKQNFILYIVTVKTKEPAFINKDHVQQGNQATGITHATSLSGKKTDSHV
jgi:hypothetical protein